jgi:2-amino-4-hydroxy-6-hydroxymethyldihydropteridine diphosphokinase
MREAVTAYIGIGANLGDAQKTVRSAVERLASLPQTRLLGSSSLYRTAPHGAAGPDYINAVASVETCLDAQGLLTHLQNLEAETGRERPYPNAPRTLDLDLLLFGAERISSNRLEVPHPRMWERAFVLVPLAELAPQAVSAERLARVADQQVTRLR